MPGAGTRRRTDDEAATAIATRTAVDAFAGVDTEVGVGQSPRELPEAQRAEQVPQSSVRGDLGGAVEERWSGRERGSREEEPHDGADPSCVEPLRRHAATAAATRSARARSPPPR